MIDPAIQAEILHLFFAEKETRRAIAAKLSISRETVGAIINCKAVRIERADMKKRVSILAPYYPMIDSLLRRDPARSAVNILQSLHGSGYTGGITILKDYLTACRPSSLPEAYLSLEIWYDNLATAVAERRGRLVRFNPRFYIYTGHHRFNPIACNPASGNEKGRVEDGVRYVRHNFWPGRSFADLDDLNAQAKEWRDVFANRRTHATTRKIPELVFDEEKKTLMPQQGSFDTDEIRSPKISHQFRIDFDGNEYSVPWRLAGRIVTLRADEKRVQIFVGNKRVTAHSRSWLKGESILRAEHEDGLRDQKPGATPSIDIGAIKSLGPNAARYVDLIPAQTHSIRREISRIMVLITIYGAHAVEAVIGKALTQAIVGAIHLERMLTLEESATTIKKPAPLSLTDPRLSLPHVTPDLKSYDAILMQPESTQGDDQYADSNRKLENA